MLKQEILEREKRWAIPVALAALLGVVALIAAGALASNVSGEGDAAILRAINSDNSSETLSGVLQALGFILFAFPLVYLFRADQARSSRVRSQLIGLVVVAPLFLAASTILSATARNDAATQFLAGNAKSTLSAKQASEDCSSQRKSEGAKSFGEEFEPSKGETALAACETRKTEDNEATNAIKEASLTGAATGFGIAGGLGIAVALFYTCLWAMRLGLLGRFWASFGMALGVAVLIGFILLPMVWFVYIGLLIAGWLPGGRPPSWAEGEAVPWPTPGQKAAAELEPADPDPDSVGPTTLGNGDAPSPPGEGRRKRKQRD
jgi:hypothetical protein